MLRLLCYFYTIKFFLFCSIVFGKTHYINPGQSITARIEKASAYDTLIVFGGQYYEHDILINKPLTIIGNNHPILNSNFKGYGFIVSSHHVIIKGFQILNIPVSYMKEYAAIYLTRSKNCSILDISIKQAFFGIYLSESDSCILQNNKILGQSTSESNSGNAIHLWKCKNILVKDNYIEKHRDGIYLEFVKKSLFLNNQSHQNIRYGMHFMFSDSSEYTGNRFSENVAGVAVMYSQNIKMNKNYFTKNWGFVSNGILLKDIKNSVIAYNVFADNTIAIYMEGCLRNTIMHNNIVKNGWALKILGTCENNNFFKNNFIDNFFEVVSNTHRLDNTFENNFWGNYSGYDLNKDGIGDIPHFPMSLTSYILEISPNAIILFQSIFLDLLNLIEKVNPEFTPTNLKDPQPLLFPLP